MTRDGAGRPAATGRATASWVVWSVTLWICVVGVWYHRFSLWFFDLVLLVLEYLLVGVAIAVTIRAARLARSRPLLMTGVVVIAVCCTTFVGWWQLAPRAWFFVHRPLFDLARVVVEPGSDDDGAPLPFPLRFLSQTGTVSTLDPGGTGGVFFPQWVGIPDDAGGYVYSSVSPEGADLYGSSCTQPRDLGGGWWMCNLS